MGRLKGHAQREAEALEKCPHCMQTMAKCRASGCGQRRPPEPPDAEAQIAQREAEALERHEHAMRARAYLSAALEMLDRARDATASITMAHGAIASVDKRDRGHAARCGAERHPRHRNAAGAVIRALAAALALVGCAVDAPTEPELYTCTIVYRCAGAEQLSAAIALPCAFDLEDALERATAAGIEAAGTRCSAPWQSVRPLCSRYEPAETCAVTEP